MISQLPGIPRQHAANAIPHPHSLTSRHQTNKQAIDRSAGQSVSQSIGQSVHAVAGGNEADAMAWGEGSG
jgi:hypothetical protein